MREGWQYQIPFGVSNLENGFPAHRRGAQNPKLKGLEPNQPIEFLFLGTSTAHNPMTGSVNCNKKTISVETR